MVCSVDGCERSSDRRDHGKKGFCSRHYQRFLRWGDPLGGNTSRGEPERYLIEEVTKYKGEDCLIWPFHRDNKGYARILQGGKGKLAHRICCREVHGNPPDESYHAAHECGNGHLGCVNPNHLSWKTCRDNLLDKIRHGTDNSCRGRKLTEENIKYIRFMAGKITQTAMSEMFGVTPAMIGRVISNKAWIKKEAA